MCVCFCVWGCLGQIWLTFKMKNWKGMTYRNTHIVYKYNSWVTLGVELLVLGLSRVWNLEKECPGLTWYVFKNKMLL